MSNEYEEEPNDREVAQRRLAKLSKNPRKISIVCVNDGYSYPHKDDGGSIEPRGGVLPNGHRKRLEDLRLKTDKQGRPLFYAATRTVDDDGKPSWAPAPIAPVYDGDPLASFQVIDDAAIARIYENLEKRAESSAKANNVDARRTLDALTRMADRVKQDAPKFERKRKAQVPNDQAV